MAERMNFEEFCNRVVQEINQEKALGESVASYEDKKIRVTERKNGRSVSTGLEPKGCYDWYAATGDFTRAYADIKENLRTAMEEFHEKVGEVRLDKESIEESLHFQLVNTERTGEILNHMPHRDMGDMSVVYCWQVADEMIGKITNQVAKSMGWTEEKLYRMAYENTRQVNPPRLESMGNMLKLLGGLDDMTNAAPAQMYVLTNQKNTAGAAMMLYDDMLEKAAEKLGGDVYVIPSSIHETLLIPAGITEAIEVQDLLREINQTLRPGDLLSNTLYMYDARAHELKPADIHPIRTSSQEVYEPVFRPTYAGGAR